MWASFRNNIGVAELLLDHDAQLNLEDNKGWNALDLAIIRMNYKVALLLKKKGLTARNKEIYMNNLW